MESTTILGAIFGLVALVLVFLLYVNRKWCFRTTSGFPCCDENSLPSKYVQKIGKWLYCIRRSIIFMPSSGFLLLVCYLVIMLLSILSINGVQSTHILLNGFARDIDPNRTTFRYFPYHIQSNDFCELSHQFRYEFGIFPE